MIYGYARISTKKQSLERQIENLKKFKEDEKLDSINVIVEIYTGTKLEERKAYQKLKGLLKAGDTLVFDSVSRMSRNAEEGVKEYFDLYKKGINLIFLKERYVDTAVYDNAKAKQLARTGHKITDILIKAVEEVLEELAKEQIEKAFEQSQKEVEDLRTRTKEALKVLHDNGVKLGRPAGRKIETKKSIEAKQSIIKLSKDFAGTLNDIDVMYFLNISRNSYYKYKRQLKNGE